MKDFQHTTGTRPGSKPDLQILVVFLAALAVRFAYFFTVRNQPYYQVPLLDSAWYHRSALEILRDGFWGREVFFRGPLYSYFVALAYRLFGENPEAPKVLQLFIGAGTCALVTAAARQVFDRRTAFISGIVAALYPTLIFFDAELLATGLASFLGVLLLYLILRADRQSTAVRWGAVGLVLGLAALTRPTVLFLGAGLVVWMLADRTRSRRALLALLAGTVVLIVPVTLRNAIVAHDFVPIASQGGVNFYMGNNPAADGKSAILPGWSEMNGDWISFESDTRKMAEALSGHALSPSQESAFWTRRALAFIARDPLEASGLLARKIYFLLNGFEISNNKDLYFFKQYSPVLNWTLWKRGLAFPGGLLIPLAVMGLLFSATRRNTRVFRLFLLCQALAIVLFFVCARFRVAILPALIPFAVWGTAETVRRVRIGVRPPDVVIGLAGAAFLFLSNSSFFGVAAAARWQDYYDLGLVHVERGEFAEAASAFEEALRLKSDDLSVLYNLGLVRMNLGDLNQAAACFGSVLERDPGAVSARNNLGIALGRMGRLDDAEREFRKVLEQDPGNPEARANLSLIDQMRGGAP